MKFKGLRTSIALDLVLLLATGMLLSNFLIVNLWLQNDLQKYIKISDSTLDLFIGENQRNCSDTRSLLHSYVEEIYAGIGRLYIFENGIFYPQENNNTLVQRSLRLAGSSHTTIVQSSTNKWSLLGLHAKEIVVAKPLVNCRGNNAVALHVDMKNIHEQIVHKQFYILVYILVNVIILATIGFFRMRKLVIRPVENLVGLAESYHIESEGLLTLSSRKSEFGHIADALHKMLTKIERDKEILTTTIQSLEKANEQLLANQKTLVEAEKFSAVGRLSAGIAHEIGNPLGIIQGYIELLEKKDLSKQDRQQYATRALKELARVTRLIYQLLDLARKKRESGSKANVQQVVSDLVEMLQHQKGNDHITISIDCRSGCMALCSEEDLHQVLLNCLLNSIDGIAESGEAQGTIEITCDIIDSEKSKIFEIVIRDDGQGVEQSNLSAVFDPFFTTKEVGRGTGLGLSVSRTIVENNGGTIQLQSDISSGTKVTIQLPAE